MPTALLLTAAFLTCDPCAEMPPPIPDWRAPTRERLSPDVDRNCMVDAADLMYVLAEYGQCGNYVEWNGQERLCCAEDITRDGRIDSDDVLEVLTWWTVGRVESPTRDPGLTPLAQVR